ncbi:uncharacterized protein P884DRAFT_274812 [Thermothelomyces heterothallicus CBS 202.75]|uniref:uncharacterized protein n=1 Tax=Thermothelomyces heterothallicus CBS 202.75 TaxID=1149848 RepID=UPI003742CED5
MAAAFPFSQASSHLPIEQPLPASLLLDREIARKEGLAASGNLMTGCRELDEYVLLGGFERGSVVGVSAEEDGEEEIGLLIGLQTVAHLLASKSTARAMVVTTLPATVLLPKLRKALVGQLMKVQGGWQNFQAELQACLERISISRVFDIEGLWEVLEELEDTVLVRDGESPRPTQTGKRSEIPNSEDDDGGLSSSEAPSSKPSPQPESTSVEARSPTLPDIILVTHTSTLLNALFTGRDKDTAHNMVLLLASRLHALTRSSAHGAPLFMFLNSTTSPANFPQPPNADDTTLTAPSRDTPRPPSKHLDSTLRSIFNPPPPPPPATQTVLAARAQQEASTSAAASSARRNKPAFGLVFSQMLDLHLLCTRVPRTRADSAALMANPGMNVMDVSYAWVVEVLLDELGVYEKRNGDSLEWRERRSREQRWAAVDVDEEDRVVNAAIP